MQAIQKYNLKVPVVEQRRKMGQLHASSMALKVIFYARQSHLKGHYNATDSNMSRNHYVASQTFLSYGSGHRQEKKLLGALGFELL